MLKIYMLRWQCYKAGEVILDTEDPKTADRVRMSPEASILQELKSANSTPPCRNPQNNMDLAE